MVLAQENEYCTSIWKQVAANLYKYGRPDTPEGGSLFFFAIYFTNPPVFLISICSGRVLKLCFAYRLTGRGGRETNITLSRLSLIYIPWG